MSEKTIALKDETLEMSAKFKEAISKTKIDPATGQSVLPADFLGSILPEGLTVENLVAANKFISTAVPAASNAWGEACVEYKKTEDKDNKHNNLSLTVPIVGKDKLEINYRHQREVRNPQTQETSIKYGTVTATYDMYATGDNGEFAKVKTLISQQASALAD